MGRHTKQCPASQAIIHTVLWITWISATNLLVVMESLLFQLSTVAWLAYQQLWPMFVVMGNQIYFTSNNLFLLFAKRFAVIFVFPIVIWSCIANWLISCIWERKGADLWLPVGCIRQKHLFPLQSRGKGGLQSHSDTSSSSNVPLCWFSDSLNQLQQCQSAIQLKNACENYLKEYHWQILYNGKSVVHNHENMRDVKKTFQTWFTPNLPL